MDKVIEEANQALFEGNRKRVLELLPKSIITKYMATMPGDADAIREVAQTLWLYANALDADENLSPEDQNIKQRRKAKTSVQENREAWRMEVLRKVRTLRVPPYAALAGEILDAELRFARELEQQPRWQRWLLRWQPYLLWLIGLTVLGSGIAIIVNAL